MTINNIISTLLQNAQNADGSKLTQVMLAKILTHKYGKEVSPAALNDRLKNENMKVNTAIEMLDILGYDLIAIPRNPQNDQYLIQRGGKRDR